MKPCVILILSGALGPSQADGAYVVSMDVDAHGGYGHLNVTANKSKAKVFDHAGDAQ